MTQEEYEKIQRNLSNEAEKAREVYLDAKQRYHNICDRMTNNRILWQEEQRAAERSTEK